MRIRLYEGPLEQWRAEAEKLTRVALLEFVDDLVRQLAYLGVRMDPGSLRSTVSSAKAWGKSVALAADYEKMNADPDAYFSSLSRRKRSAKAASRRRRRELRKRGAR
jgi:hypothetical protein